MSVTGLAHMAIQVQDLDRSIRFYERLGLICQTRFINDRPYVQRLTGYPGVTLHVAFLSIPYSSAFLEVLKYEGAGGTRIDPATGNPGTSHICFRVDDLDDLYLQLRHDVTFISAPQTPDVGPNRGGRSVYAIDPDGIRVELWQQSSIYA